MAHINPMSEPGSTPSARRGSGEIPAEPDARHLIEQLPAIVYVADVGVDGNWRYVSPGVRALLGYSPEDWLADPDLWARQVHPDDRARVFAREDDLVEPTVPEEYRMRHRDGRTVWVRDEAALVTDAEGNAQWHGVISDVSDRKRAEAELERRAQQQAAVARLGKHALEGANVSDLMHDALDEATRILGVESGAVLEQASDEEVAIVRARLGPARQGLGAGASGQVDNGLRRDDESLRDSSFLHNSNFPRNSNSPRDSSSPHPAGRLSRRVQDAPSDGERTPRANTGGDSVTCQIEGRDGRWGTLWLASASRPRFEPSDVDFVQALANILADALQQRATEDDIRYQALHDPLTSLPNRVLFLDRLGHALSRPSAKVAVVLLDIDNFKLVNDSLGHSAGDELLMEIAPRLKTALRPEDTIARLGGDEFVVLLEHIEDERAAARVAKRIVAAFETPFRLSVGEYFTKVSLGIALAGAQNSHPAELISDADAAMYQAKEHGRARYEIFDGAMRARVVERLSVENDLRRALERDELQLIYQPIVSLRTKALASVEALARWRHPTRGLVGPSEFIPIAEESGLIEPIGRWVLDSACAQAAHWHAQHRDRPPLGISVNLSIQQFRQRDLEATVAAALARTGIEPSSLCLEITESVLLQEADAVRDTMTRLAQLGVRFVLDDFGTGYSSLAYLTQLPIDGLKIDRSFVEELGSSRRSTAITTAIVRMAQALSVEVIAEGVESQLQIDALRALDCELGQGFHFHRPLSAAGVSKLLDAEPS
ncbi:MAG TPA: EAL domain-containing protein [Solirubrobacteraceae bacterium]|jgi:diguanylate cyclase (GGDEF)-like protein/PAS domain S-box-containing protein